MTPTEKKILAVLEKAEGWLDVESIADVLGNPRQTISCCLLRLAKQGLAAIQRRGRPEGGSRNFYRICDGVSEKTEVVVDKLQSAKEATKALIDCWNKVPPSRLGRGYLRA